MRIEVQKNPYKGFGQERPEFFEMEHPYVDLSGRWNETSNNVLRDSNDSSGAYGDNANKCFGVVGSGNRNFNNQYCPTAKSSILWETWYAGEVLNKKSQRYRGLVWELETEKNKVVLRGTRFSTAFRHAAPP